MAIVRFSLLLSACAGIPTAAEADELVRTLRGYEDWAWAVGVALIWSDLVLPVPQTVVIAALGMLYGPLLGALLGSVGLVTGGLLAYALMRTSARRFVRRLVPRRSLQRMDQLFDRAGAWAIVLTRALPYSLSEAMVFLAGLAKMPAGKVVAALIAGSVPAAVVFALIGAGWASQPALALAVSYVVPIVLLPVALYLMRREPSS
jgi:uncharacterized membrane protein YdjX (TVP38/TMEM64 family)